MKHRPAPRSWQGLDRLTHVLVIAAARCAPESLASRLEEEWLADLSRRTGSLARLRLALGCCWATRSINRELWPAAATTIAAVAAGTPASASAPRWHAWPNRSIALLVLLAVHVAILYALATALVQRAAPLSPTTQAALVPEARQPEVLPPITGPRLWRPTTAYTEPPIRIDPIVEPEGEPRAPTHESGANDTQPPAQASTRVAGGPGPGFPSSDAFYPAAARRLGEQGAVTLSVCVDAAGQLTALPIVTESSGSSRLDGGAIRLAHAGSGHYRPMTVNGRAVASCYPLRVRFELRN